MNGGTCYVNQNGVQQCKCQFLYSGSNCQNYNNPCNSYPCQNNGICTLNAIFGTYTCTCIGQYTGLNCGSSKNKQKKKWRSFCRKWKMLISFCCWLKAYVLLILVRQVLVWIMVDAHRIWILARSHALVQVDTRARAVLLVRQPFLIQNTLKKVGGS